MPKVFKDELKAIVWVQTHFSKFPGQRSSKTDVALRCHSRDKSAPQKGHKQVAYRLLIGRCEVPCYFCLIS